MTHAPGPVPGPGGSDPRAGFGLPRPAPAPATLGSRLLARLIDLAAMIAVAGAVGGAVFGAFYLNSSHQKLDDLPAVLFGLAAGVVSFIAGYLGIVVVPTATRGRSFGKAAMGIEVVPVHGRGLWWRGLIREFVFPLGLGVLWYVAFSLIGGPAGPSAVDVLFPLIAPAAWVVDAAALPFTARRCLHDLAAGTVVVRA